MKVYRSSLMLYVILLPVCLMAGMAFFYPYSKIELQRFQKDLRKFSDAYSRYCLAANGTGPNSWSDLNLPESVVSNLKSWRLQVVWELGTNQIDVATIPASVVVLAFSEKPLDDGTHVVLMADGSLARLNFEIIKTRLNAWEADLFRPNPQNVF